MQPEVCYRHPNIETRLRCSRCDKPMCIHCAQETSVGYRCPDCVHELQSRHYQPEPSSGRSGAYLNPLRAPRSQPFLTYFLIGIIAVIWLLEELAGGSTNTDVLIRFGAMFGPGIIAEGEVWRFFTAMFLHIGLIHLLFNGYALYILGRDMEALYGQDRFLVIYLLSGMFGNLASFFLRGPSELSAGASGAVFGLIGMSLAFFLFHRKQLGAFGRRQIQSIAQLIVLNLIIGFTIPAINNAAHLGGLIAGFILGFLLVPRYRPALSDEGNYYADLGSIRRRWWVPVLASVVFVAGTWVAMIVIHPLSRFSFLVDWLL